MGHRALVAFQRENGKYDTYYSHWGALNLCLKAPLEDGLKPGESAGRLPTVPVEHNEARINEDPSDVEVTLSELGSEIIEYWQIEAVYVVPSIGEVTAYVTLDFDLDADGARSTHDGAVVAPRWYAGEPLISHITPRFRGWKDVYTDLVESRSVLPGNAKYELEKRVYEKWGAPPRPTEIPVWSPRGHKPAQGLISLSDRIAKAEQGITDPNR